MLTFFIVVAVLVFVAALVFLVGIAALLSACLVHRHENGVVVRLRGVKDPAPGLALTLLKPVMDRITKGNRQVMTLSVSARDCLAKDSGSVRVDTVVCVRIADTIESDGNMLDSRFANSQPQTSLPSKIGTADLDDLVSNGENLGAELIEIIHRRFAPPLEVIPDESSHIGLHGSDGPQDAPRADRWDAGRGRQDGEGGPQDAAQTDLSMERIEESVDPLDTLSLGGLELLGAKPRHASEVERVSRERSPKSSPAKRRVLADQTSTTAEPRARAATRVLRPFAAGRRMPFVMFVRDGSRVRAGDVRREPADVDERSLFDSVPRPLAGPAYLGGREDAAYLRGWDDGFDWIRQGNEGGGPSWGGVAYMTGWNDAVKAIAKARRD